jgi:hypothetical protein
LDKKIKRIKLLIFLSFDYICIFFSYYKSQLDKKLEKEELDSEAESISDTEFDEFLFKNEVDGADAVDDDLDLDYAKYEHF